MEHLISPQADPFIRFNVPHARPLDGNLLVP